MARISLRRWTPVSGQIIAHNWWRQVAIAASAFGISNMATEVISQSWLAGLATSLNVPEAAVRLLASILLGFPLALFHRYKLYGKEQTLQHIFFILSGLSIGYWNYGTDILHSAFSLCVTYLILKIVGGTNLSVIMSFVFNLTYLLVGYYTTSTEEYDIKWTMPQCVLTLRLIGLAFDLYDGRKKEEMLSASQKETALKSVPSFLEIAAYIYFPGSFLVGPQFSMNRYLKYVNGELRDPESSNELPPCIVPGFLRALAGFGYIIVFQLGSMYVSDDYIVDSSFSNESFWKRWFLLGLWGRVNLYKYISCWLITEGVCIVFGITYNGKDENGVQRWDGCANVKLLVFENATQFNHYILSFNTNTNHWCAEYIYKRLKFLGSKFYSQAATLIFLAVWHGFHSGYYICFFIEFIIMYFEKDIGPVLNSNKKLQAYLSNPIIAVLVWFVMKIYTFVFMGYALIPFVLLKHSKYLQVFATFHFLGHILFMGYPLIAPFLKSLIRENRQRSHNE
ncbi:lysophospholipid acyltransferase 5 [Neodiprion fabricii]|uniref:lysophospholipid acyltransferase 5 n=1 Tax=Neodiprion fabricii TaxID=2872261 RepID=UPI001ED8E222|nr:lysophospholipid acyltransferase 5 [Neodiprion fabricii]